MRYILFPSVLLLSLLVSGCTVPTFPSSGYNSQTPEGSGVILESFEADFPESFTGEEIRLTLKMRNSGSVKAENGRLEISGFDSSWNLKPVNEPGCNNIDLLPADPVTGTMGSDMICTWDITTPEIPKGLRVSFAPTARLYYDTGSYVTKTVNIVPREDLKNLQQQGKSLPSESVSKSSSPVDIDVQVSTPIRTTGLSAGDVQFPIVITVRNVGGGTVRDRITGRLHLLRMNIDVSGMTLDSCETTEEVYLTMGSSQTYTCLVSTISPERVVQKTIGVEAEYQYIVDKSTSISVENP